MSSTPEPFDVTDGRFYDDPWETYRWLRDHDPVHWDERNELWVISRHADVVHVSLHPETYTSRFGVRPGNDSPLSILTLDEPAHSRQRRLISKGFTPRQVRRLEPHIRQLSAELVDEVEARGEIEFVGDLAIHVPLIVAAELMGLDPDAHEQLYKWSDAMVGGDGAEPDDPAVHAAHRAFEEYVTYLLPVIEARRAEPREDLISILTGAFDEGALDAGDEAPLVEDGLSADELLMFLVALIVAGNETTRNAISSGMIAFSRFPGEKQRLIEHPELMDTAVDEIVRWMSPVLNFRRTVTVDHELHGKQLHTGDKVLMLYQSANRDERVFDDPDEFRIDRKPNPHVAFGIGNHYCLGASLAKLEIRSVFEELFRRLPDIQLVDPDRIQRAANALVLGVERLPATFTPK
jgi:cytochrome P450 family 142 subfamily A polypeptide 1